MFIIIIIIIGAVAVTSAAIIINEYSNFSENSFLSNFRYQLKQNSCFQMYLNQSSF